MKTKKIPMRTCVITREKYPKKELIFNEYVIYKRFNTQINKGMEACMRSSTLSRRFFIC